MSGRRVLMALACVLLSLGLGHALQRVAERGRFAASYSTYGAGPQGTRALLLLTRQLGYRAEPHTRELTHLPRGTLVLVAGCKAELARAVARPEREALSSWVEAGGLLIVAGRADLLPESAGMGTARDEPCLGLGDDHDELTERIFDAGEDEPPRSLEALAVGPPLTHLLSFQVADPLPLKLAHDTEATELLSSERGPLGLTAPFGRGRIVLLGIPDALTNARVSDGGGIVFARLLKAFAPSGPVLFDEYHLGMGERRTLVGYLRDAGWGWLLLQAVLVGLAAMFAPFPRLLPAREAPAQDAPARSFLEAQAALYERTRDTQGALSLLAEHALTNIARGYHLPPSQALPEQLAAAGHKAVAELVRRLLEHGQRPLAPGETLVTRAQQIAGDETAALVIGDAL